MYLGVPKKNHIKLKLTEIKIRKTNLSWQLECKSQMTMGNILIIQTQIPMVWYGARLWAYSRTININIIAVSYETYSNRHRDFNIEIELQIIKKIALNHTWRPTIIRICRLSGCSTTKSYIRTQQDPVIETALVFVVIRNKSRVQCL